MNFIHDEIDDETDGWNCSVVGCWLLLIGYCSNWLCQVYVFLACGLDNRWYCLMESGGLEVSTKLALLVGIANHQVR